MSANGRKREREGEVEEEKDGARGRGRLNSGEEKLERERRKRRRGRVCVGGLVGRESACQKNLPLTEGMIHSGERGRGARERDGDKQQKKRKTAEVKIDGNDGAKMPVRKNK